MNFRPRMEEGVKCTARRIWYISSASGARNLSCRFSLSACSSGLTLKNKWCLLKSLFCKKKFSTVKCWTDDVFAVYWQSRIYASSKIFSAWVCSKLSPSFIYLLIYLFIFLLIYNQLCLHCYYWWYGRLHYIFLFSSSLVIYS